ncbi:hypothetical protein HPB51_028318 [Rhipicephalus microplus]|uniref:Uncharacterized protein n=1 Tax=Rhipicephalus microplus TaxID=6941 RepID=A0A9J6CY53_RHIMP|nr:hypothetical protein HPB51_028318 [Rhipicephalus microplus]
MGQTTRTSKAKLISTNRTPTRAHNIETQKTTTNKEPQPCKLPPQFQDLSTTIATQDAHPERQEVSIATPTPAVPVQPRSVVAHAADQSSGTRIRPRSSYWNLRCPRLRMVLPPALQKANLVSPSPPPCEEDRTQGSHLEDGDLASGVQESLPRGSYAGHRGYAVLSSRGFDSYPAPPPEM